MVAISSGRRMVVVVGTVVLVSAAGVSWAFISSDPTRDTGTVAASQPSSAWPAEGVATSGTSVPAPSPSSGSPTSAAPTPPTARPTVTSTAPASPATLTRGVTAEVVRVEPVSGVASQPGEIAGPAVRLTVRIRNATSSALPLHGAVVNAYSGPQRQPADLLSGPGVRAFPASVAAGDAVDGVFVVGVPPARRASLVVEVDLSAYGHPVLFTNLR